MRRAPLTLAASKVQVALVPKTEIGEKRLVSGDFGMLDRKSGVK
jgi:hypothetical protein